MAKDDVADRLAFLGLSEEDRRSLASLEPILEQHADVLVSAFYRHLLSFAETRALLRDPEVTQRLLHKQRAYLLSLASGRFDDEYVAERLAIGETHERIRLEPRYYLGAYAVYFSLLAPLVRESFRSDPNAAERAIGALVKTLLFDAELAMEAYIARHERQLEYMNRELANQGRHLQREVQEQQIELRQSVQRARAAEDLASVATLVAGLAHEIGTPMGVIQGHADLLESAVTDERGRWRLRTIREQIDRISRVIQALLGAARPRDPVRVPLDLAPVLDTALSFLAEKLRQRGVRVDCDYQPSPQVRGDPEKLQQLFLNLFLNAADAMPDGGKISVTLRPDGAGHVEIAISDTGTGIPAEQLARIFEPFYTTKAAGEGSGLGLVVARGIVSDHDGEILVASEPGRGTEFTITLPALAGVAPTAG